MPPLEALVDAEFEVALVVSRADARRGRGGASSASPVKATALELGLPVTDRIDDALDVAADLGVVVAYGRILRPPLLERLPLVNLHFSLLPRWRGAAPVEGAILAGDERTGVDLMVVEEGLDTGPIHRRVELAIGAEETAVELRGRLASAGSELLVGALREGLGEPTPQSGEPTYADKITPAELELHWDRPAAELHRVVRVGGAWTTFRGRRFKVYRARLVPDDLPVPEPGRLDGTGVGTGAGRLELVEVQPEGKARQSAVDWARGARLGPYDRLGS